MKKRVKRFILTGFLWLAGMIAHAQNLVPNGDFEEAVVCFEYNLECGPMGWRLSSTDPPNYYSEFKKGDSVASSHWTAFVPFSFHRMGVYREYLQTEILCPLIKGHQYQFSLQVKAEEFAVKEFGVLFVPRYILQPENQLIMATPQLVFTAERFLYQPDNTWITLTGKFTANGTEQFLLIGNFKSNNATRYKEIEFEGKEKKQSTYYVDNVTLTAVDHDPVCDVSKPLSRLRKNRWRHTNPEQNFFPQGEPEIPIAFDSIKPEQVKINQPIILRNIFFDVDKYELLPNSNSELDNLYTLLTKNIRLSIEIRGHTDNTGDDKHNRELSFQRAMAVSDYLISKGISKQRISVKGLASDFPIDTNQTLEGRQNNRRVEFILK